MSRHKDYFEEIDEIAKVMHVALDASGQMMLREYPGITEELLRMAQEAGQSVSVLVASIAQKALMQMDYLFNRAHVGQVYEGEKWLRLSLREFCTRTFRFISISTLSRAMNLLQLLGLIKVENLNPHRYDQTRWYALDPEGLQKLTTLKVNIFSTDEAEDRGRQVIDRFNAMQAEETLAEEKFNKEKLDEEDADAATADSLSPAELEKALRLALAELCHIDLGIKHNREKVNGVVKDLIQQGYTPLHLKWVERFWKYRYFVTKKPGKQGEIPALGNVLQLIQQAVQLGQREGWGETDY